MGITWPLLLSLSLLLHRVTSDGDTNTTIPNPVATVKTENSITTINTATVATVTTATAAASVTAAAFSTAAATTAAVTTPAATTAAATTEARDTKGPTEATAATREQVASSVASQASSASSTVASPAAVTGTTVRPTTLNLPDDSTDAVKQVGTDEPVERSALPHTEGSSRQPTSAAATPSISNVFKTPATPTTAAAGGSDTYKVEVTSTAVTMPTTTRSQQGPKVPSGPETISVASDLNTPTPTPVVPTPSTARTGHEPLDTSSVTTPTTPTKTSAAEPQLKTFEFSLKSKNEEQREFVEVCKRLMVNMEDGKCILKWQNDSNKVQFQSVELIGTVKLTLANQYHDELTKKPTDNTTLVAILASCGALLVMIIILAVCASHHRKPYNETQQHLTEELHTVENGYHDNPTLEVMEVQPEMQEKKMALNGEFNDSWIVPMDNLLKEDVPDEEDTHL